jgi:hypothetical protein
MPCDPPQQTLVDIVRKAIPHDLAIVDRGRSSIDLACWIAEDNIPRLMTHGIVVEIVSEAGFTAGRYGGDQQRNQWTCQLSMRLYLPQDMPDQTQYAQDITYLENYGMRIPSAIANMQDAAARLMIAIRKSREVMSVIESPPLQRDVSNGEVRLALRMARVRFNVEAPLDAVV